MKLSICIPTYERKDKVKEKIRFFLDEIRNKNYDLNIIVRDNGSDISILNELVNEFGNKKEVFISRNNENVGLVGNLKLLNEDASSEYIWFVGDDDDLKTGIVSEVYNSLDYKKGLIFINHRAVNVNGDVLLNKACDNQRTIYDVFNYSGTTMMFISACVYKKKHVDQMFKTEEVRLTLPLLISFYCFEKDGFHIIDDIYIDNVWGDTSWSESSREVFGYGVPLELIKIFLCSAHKQLVAKTLFKYMRKQYKKSILYLLRDRWKILK